MIKDDTIEKLKQSEELFQGCMKIAPISVGVHQDGRWVLINDYALSYLGYQQEELLGEPVLDIVHPDYRDLAKSRIQEALKTGDIAPQIEYKLLASDGSIKYALISGMPIIYMGKPAMQVFAQDITENKQKDVELVKLSEAVKQTADYVIITDRDGKIEYVNHAFEHQTGYSSKEVRGRNPRILNSGKHPKSFYKQLWDVITSGKPFKGEFINKKKNGEFYHEAKTITPIRNEQNTITHFVSTGKDISQQMFDRENLQNSKKKLQNSEKKLQNSEKKLQNSEKKLQKSVHILEQKNIALKELSSQLNMEKQRIEEQVQLNVQKLIIPDLNNLKTKVDKGGGKIIRLIEESLAQITSSFGKVISTEMLSLTSKEIEICKMIKSGMTSKTIAAMMNLSFRTIEVHRYNIRKKLKIDKSQVNLATYLNAML